MSPKKSPRSIATLLAVAVVQVGIQLCFAAPTSSPETAILPQQQFIARLTTTGGPINVNGVSMSSGGNLLTGATIETPAAVSATIDLGTLGTVELQENSTIQLDFAKDGTVRVKILRGCAGIKKKGAGQGEVYTAEGASEKTNRKRRGMGFCYAAGGLAAFGGTTALGGLGVGVTAGIAGAAVVVPVVIVVVRGINPSPMRPDDDVP
jgi:hypothetical protein